QDPAAGLFFMRVEWALEGFDVPRFEEEFRSLASELNMRWTLESNAKQTRVAMLVSQHLHCLADILQRHRSGELRCEIPLVIGNHPDAAPLAQFHGTAFHHIPTLREGKRSAEQEQLRLLRD